jgi:hypothetical protein
MMAQLPITPPRNDRSVPTDRQADSLNLVAVVSESPHEAIGRLASTVSVRLRGFANDSRRVRYTRVAAHTVGGSAAWLLRRTGKTGVCAMTAGLFGMAPGDPSRGNPVSVRGVIRCQFARGNPVSGVIRCQLG